MSIWGEYQSVIQLSVALNTAYAALATYLGGDLSSEQQALQETDAAVLKDKREAKKIALSNLHLLGGELTHAAQCHEAIIDKAVRPTCLVVSLFGIALLVVSSILYSEPIDIAWQFLCIFLLLPFLAGVGFTAVFIMKIRCLRAKRKTLENELLKDT